MQFQTLGKPTSLQFGATEEAERRYTISDAITRKLDAELSDLKLFKVLNSFRSVFGRHSIQSGIKAAILSTQKTQKSHRNL